MLYLNGEGVVKDYEAAIVWFEKAAAMDYPLAIHNLGVVFAKKDFARHADEKALPNISPKPRKKVMARLCIISAFGINRAASSKKITAGPGSISFKPWPKTSRPPA